ncbi:MAG: diacylglycerol kinase [Actinomycetota bacterium]|jgi:diacylglycerol kinase (ATP)|nr:diacylglycerol kinase [Actinomycetota bacterium]
MRFSLVVNPTSGKGRAAAAADIATAGLTAAGHTVDRLVGVDGADAQRLCRVAAGNHVDAIVAVGGDGMAHLALQACAGTVTALGIVPTGTGNDLATALGLPRGDPSASTALLVEGAVREIDAVRCGDAWWACVLGTGFDAAVNDRANRMRWPRGRRRYDLAILAELRSYRPRHFVLDIDGMQAEVDAMLVALGNAPSYGGGMKVCPNAKLDDGLLDVVVVGPLTRRRFLRLFPRVFAGTHIADPSVTVYRGREVSVSGPATAYADGEPMGPLPLSSRVEPGALRVIGVPSGT